MRFCGRVPYLFVFTFCVLSINAAIKKSAKKEVKQDEENLIPSPGYLMNELDYQWPEPSLRPYFGQIGGVAEDIYGNVFVFHRAERVWDSDDFNEKYSYVRAKYGPIKSKTIVILNKKGKESAAFGSDLFYLPHGISLDYSGSIWVTDVALHQVMKFEYGKKKPSVILGDRLIPGHDDKHFCQPTSVAVSKSGQIFVADGYCNSRIMKFSPNGTLLRKWGRARRGNESLSNEHLSIPHSITLDEDRDLVCVADREHGRIQCYRAGLKDKKVTGKFAFSIMNPDFGKVYAVNYNPAYDVLLILGTNEEVSRGFIYSMSKKTLVDRFLYPSEQGFGYGHTLTSSDAGDSLVVGSLMKVCPDMEAPECEDSGYPEKQNLFRFKMYDTDELAAIL